MKRHYEGQDWITGNISSGKLPTHRDVVKTLASEVAKHRDELAVLQHNYRQSFPQWRTQLLAGMAQVAARGVQLVRVPGGLRRHGLG